MLSYPQFVRFVKQVFSLTVRRTRLENLQLLQGRSCCLSRIARFFPLPTDYNHRLRRLWRFLTNPHFIPEQVYPQLIRALAPCWPAQLPMPPAGPRSARVGCRLSARLAGGGYQPQPPGHAFIAAVTSALRAVRPQMRLVWIADRGFARLSELPAGGAALRARRDQGELAWWRGSEQERSPRRGWSPGMW
jgi:hypothetical protein